ncbi:hypothetical protein PAMP_019964 [Pampus punctatissimus]
MAATLLPLTYHPKHYHKLLPGCQATHTAKPTVRDSALLVHVKIALSEVEERVTAEVILASWWARCADQDSCALPRPVGMATQDHGKFWNLSLLAGRALSGTGLVGLMLGQGQYRIHAKSPSCERLSESYHIFSRWKIVGQSGPGTKTNTAPIRSSPQGAEITHQGLSLALDPCPGLCDGEGRRLSGPEETTHHSCVQLHTGYISVGSQGVRKEPNPADFGTFVLYRWHG